MIEQPEKYQRGREWSRREPSDIDDARKGELSGESESIEPGRQTKSPFRNKPARGSVAGAGIEPARKRLMRPLPSHLATPHYEIGTASRCRPELAKFWRLRCADWRPPYFGKLVRSAGIAPASPGWHPGILLSKDDRDWAAQHST